MLTICKLLSSHAALPQAPHYLHSSHPTLHYLTLTIYKLLSSHAALSQAFTIPHLHCASYSVATIIPQSMISCGHLSYSTFISPSYYLKHSSVPHLRYDTAYLHPTLHYLKHSSSYNSIITATVIPPSPPIDPATTIPQSMILFLLLTPSSLHCINFHIPSLHHCHPLILTLPHP